MLVKKFFFKLHLEGKFFNIESKMGKIKPLLVRFKKYTPKISLNFVEIKNITSYSKKILT